MNRAFGYASIELSAHSAELATHVNRTLRQGILRVAHREDDLQHVFTIKL